MKSEGHPLALCLRNPEGTNAAILIIAQRATSEMLAYRLHARPFDKVKANIQAGAVWEQFCTAAKAGLVSPGWLPGTLGRVVLSWAKNGVPIPARRTAIDEYRHGGPFCN